MIKKVLSSVIVCAALTIAIPSIHVGGDISSITTPTTNIFHFHVHKAEAAENAMYKCKRCGMVISVRPGDSPGQSALFPCSKEDPYHEWKRIN